MICNLSSNNIRVPNGFAITTVAYQHFIKHNNLENIINELMNELDVSDLVNLRNVGTKIRLHIVNGEFPDDLKKNILDHYHDMSNETTTSVTTTATSDTTATSIDITDTDRISVAVRSSSTAEDLEDASFAGQQDTYLNVHGDNHQLNSIKDCFASLYTDRAISYRKTIGYDKPIDISVCVQRMVRSDLGSAGVAFSIDPETGFKDVVVINGSYGLGEIVVQGAVKPDEFIVYKNKLNEEYNSIIDKKIGDKIVKMVYSNDPLEKVKEVEIGKHTEEYNSFCLKDEHVIQLAKWVTKIEKYYSELYDKWCPVDIEWAIDGLTDELFIVQARPETVQSNKKNHNIIHEYHINKTDDTELLVSGIAVGDKVSTGIVKIIPTLSDDILHNIDFNEGDILVTDNTDPDWEPIMVKASAIITNRGGRTAHCAIIARELGINAIVGTGNCTEVLEHNQEITVSCAEGEVGFVYDGIVDYDITDIDLNNLQNIKTNLMFNIASPSNVFSYANYPATSLRGVGLVREEFIINNYIQAHPMALINYDNLEDAELKKSIDELTIGYESPEDYYVNKLCYGLSRIASTFYPYEVIIRFSDFKSNEYRNLLGGKYYEPDEENPMIGWRGASRYYADNFKEAFGLECKAIKKIRDEIGLDNVVVMIPFCRTPEECILVQKTMAEYGLVRGENGLKVYIMCEIPSNVILADEFCKYVDGFSIGSNDLTQLTLGLDRDSALVSHIYDERNPCVKKMISKAIRTCKKHGVKIGICGQGPSDYPDFAQFLVEQEIDSISITPDALLKTLNAIHKIENTIKI
jgi:pyruvate,water dikinase